MWEVRQLRCAVASSVNMFMLLSSGMLLMGGTEGEDASLDDPGKCGDADGKGFGHCDAC